MIVKLWVILSALPAICPNLLSRPFTLHGNTDDFSTAVRQCKQVGTTATAGVLGSIVAMQTGIPEVWLRKLRMMEKLRCDIQVLPNHKVLKRVI